MKFTGRVWRAGNSLVVTIPKNQAKLKVNDKDQVLVELSIIKEDSDGKEPN